jgi:hypothetical protein
MKNYSIYFLMLLFTVATVIGGCKKDDDDNNNNSNNNNNNAPSNPVPEFGDADAVLAAIRVNSTQNVPAVGTVNVVLDAASGAFFSGTNYYDAGTVKLNTVALTKYSNNTYAFTSTTPDALNFSTGSPVNWDVSGSANITAFTHTTTNVMVEAQPLASSTPSNIDIDANVTLSLEGYPTHASEILWLIIDKNGKVVKKTNNATSVTFTTSELSTLAKGANALIQVAAYNYSSDTKGGKKVYFVNETATTKSVTLE